MSQSAHRRATAATAVVWAFLRQGELLGLRPEAVLDAAGISLRTMRDPDARIPSDQLVRLVDHLLSGSADPAFALHAAQNLPMGEFGVIDFVVVNAPNLGEGLRRLTRYFRLLTDVLTLTYGESEEAGSLRLEIAPSAEALESVAVDFTLGCVRTRSGRTTFGLLPLTGLRLRRRKPKNAGQLERFFEAAIEYGCEENAAFVDLSRAHCQVEQASPHLCSILEKVGDESLARLPTKPSFTAEVRAVLEKSLVGGVASAPSEVARRLAVSERTLQRRLQGEGVSFSALLEETRRRLACELLRRPGIAVAEIGYVLGFSSASAFHRAFKRWTGRTPLAFRAEHLPSPSE